MVRVLCGVWVCMCVVGVYVTASPLLKGIVARRCG